MQPPQSAQDQEVEEAVVVEEVKVLEMVGTFEGY
jgi:hypothetical protein